MSGRVPAPPVLFIHKRRKFFDEFIHQMSLKFAHTSETSIDKLIHNKVVLTNNSYWATAASKLVDESFAYFSEFFKL